MNRREFLGTGLAAGIYSTRSEMISPLLFDAEAPTIQEAGATPSWLNDAPIIMAGCWDDFPLFQKRMGGTSTWLNDLYRKQSADSTVSALKEAGVTLGIIHFFKGFGLNAERDHIADARVLSRKLKENGIRVSTIDVAWTEEGDNATVTPEGALVSRSVRSRAASIMKKKIFCYTWGADGNWGYRPNSGGLLQMAESMTYNRQCLGMVGIFGAVPELPAEPRQYIQFYRQNFHLYREVESVADVALLYSFSSMGFNSDRPIVSFMLASQMLIQGQFLFDIIFDQHLNHLSKYRVLFLADQESLSDGQIQQIREFVTQGGGLVATGHTSLYTERRERRPDFGLKDCFGVSAPAWYGSDVEEPNVPGGPVQNRVGKGKVTYIPEITPTSMKLPHQGPGRKQHYWNLAANNNELSNGVLAAMNGAPTVRLTSSASPYITLEMIHQQAENRLVLHMPNYDHARNPELQDLAFEATLPASRKVRSVRALSPDQLGANRQLESSGNNRIAFRVPTLKVYTVVVIELM